MRLVLSLYVSADAFWLGLWTLAARDLLAHFVMIPSDVCHATRMSQCITCCHIVFLLSAHLSAFSCPQCHAFCRSKIELSRRRMVTLFVCPDIEVPGRGRHCKFRDAAMIVCYFYLVPLLHEILQCVSVVASRSVSVAASGSVSVAAWRSDSCAPLLSL